MSPNIVEGLKLAKERGLRIFGVVGRDGRFTKKVGDCVVVIQLLMLPGLHHTLRPFRRWFGTVWCLTPFSSNFPPSGSEGA